MIARYCVLIVALTCSAVAAASVPYDLILVTNHMTEGRWAPACAALGDGRRVLIAGGFDYALGECVSSADIYELKANRFMPSRSRLACPRDFAQALTLSDGTVLIAGGFNDVLGSVRVAEIYDPATDSFHTVNGMNVPRELFQVVRLKDGRVMAIGGLCTALHRTVATCEIYDPATGKWTYVSGLNIDRFGHAACMLADGRVFVVGGTSTIMRRVGGRSETLKSAEIFDPATGVFTLAAGMLSAARDRPTATLLPTGKVLVAGGQGPGSAAVTYCEVFDPLTGQFTRLDAPPMTPRMAHSASLLPDGRVLLSGGWDSDAKATTGTEVAVNPFTATVDLFPNIPFAAHDLAQVPLAGGAVLIAAGKSVTVKGDASSVGQGVVLMPVTGR